MNIFWTSRICLLYFCSFTILIFYFFLSMIFMWLPYNRLYNILVQWSYITIWLAKVICGLKYELSGKENIPKNAVIVMSNHQTMWDTIIMQVIIPPQTWILKKELLSIPFFGWLLRTLKPIAIDRKKSSSIKQLISQGIKRLKEDVFIIMFPEGTRVPVNKTKPFTRSGAALAIAANSSILPIAHNAGEFWPKGLWIKKPGTIKIVIGPLITINDKNAKEITQEVENWINAKRKEL